MTCSKTYPGVLVALVAIFLGSCSFDVRLPKAGDTGGNVDIRSGTDVGSADVPVDVGKDAVPEDGGGDVTPEDGGGDGAPPKECEADDDCKYLDEAGSCVIHECNSVEATCQPANAPDGKQCEDADPCTVKSECEQGECEGVEDKKCDDENPCTSDECEWDSGDCVHKPKNEGGSCDDGVACTKNTKCKGGACIGEVNCDDGDPCTEDWCDWEGGEVCVHDQKPGCGEECAGDGEMLEPGDGPSECCENLKKLQVCEYNQEIPCDPDQPDIPCEEACGCSQEKKVCTKCFDGSCGPGENPCNCPEDCPFGPGPCGSDADCFDGAVCIEGQCIICGIEICDDGADNDCDGQIDEPGCTESNCAAPDGYEATSMEKLLSGTGIDEKALVALWGFCIALFNDVQCAPDPNCGEACCDFCSAPIALAQGPGTEIFLYGNSEVNIGCKLPICGLGDMDPMELIEKLKETCVPPVESDVFVWGVYSQMTEDGNLEKNIAVDGFCTL